ncbi:hypothetical protein CBR_g40440 [Chara braunii]|uniref:Probable magnesium transporter n=1 Tax=Chara braunii TaxID=69332 RepID=A0A388LTW7_CHABU|nr:hypothetical protein CBR_g40440 [Chara braunii]|eukprot:GBG85711.1 hypothetical protein CBR_g40440 [Chara braunii]
MLLFVRSFLFMQSLLAALGSVQFISNVAFAYLVLKETVTGRIMIATGFIVVGNIFLVSFGNHQSKTYSHQELLRNYIDHVFLVYVFGLLLLVLLLYFTYRKGRQMIAAKGDDGVGIYWHMLLPFSYAMVSGIIGTQSVLFAKSLSILLRLTVNGDSQLNGWFTYVVLTLFIMTAAFWMIRLNQGLAMFDAILIVPMLQIVWTFFSISTGFVYFEEYQVFNSFKASMFGLGVLCIICGMFLLSPRGGKEMDDGDKELQLEVEEFRELKRMSTCKRTGQGEELIPVILPLEASAT